MSSVVEGEQYCRDSWMPSIKLDHFVPYACAKCFVQVFFDHKPLTMHLPPRPPFHLTHRNDTNLTFPPNPDAPSNNSACTQYLTSKECDTWRQCCQAAQRCCETPEPISRCVQNGPRPTCTSQSAGDDQCPSTWDGVSCWPATQPGETHHQKCPRHYVGMDIKWINREALLLLLC